MDYDADLDCITYMRNNPTFYTQKYYPCMSKISDIMDMKKSIKSSHFAPMVKQGMQEYKIEYDLPDDVFTKDSAANIIKLIAKEEMPQIRSGEYRCR